MLVDEATITIKAGKGGPGKVSFFPGHKTGPDGGDGGTGGDVYVMGDRQWVSLNYYAQKGKHAAENGNPGEGQRRTGADGKDLTLHFPIGTLLRDIETGEEIEINQDGETFLVCKGGKGGKGNDAFKSSTNTTPRFAQPGLPGQQRTFKVILRLIADYGLIGLPNAGKSSLLNELTNANVRTANYPFTTLEPNLGVVNDKILADIPGLIEGASSGKGLGIKFLKHIEKVSRLFHCIAADSDDVLRDYDTIRQELHNFNTELLHKPETILLTKRDLINDNDMRERVHQLKQRNQDVHVVSIYDPDAIEQLKNIVS